MKFQHPTRYDGPPANVCAVLTDSASFGKVPWKQQVTEVTMTVEGER